jgi:hypothetical protein
VYYSVCLAKGIGVSPILLPSAPEIHRPARQTVPQHAPIINPRLDKIVMMANNRMIDLYQRALFIY